MVLIAFICVQEECKSYEIDHFKLKILWVTSVEISFKKAEYRKNLVISI